MLKINVAIVHGIGTSTQGYAEPLIDGVRTQFNRALKDILKTTDDYAEQLNFIPIVWDDIVAPQEAKLADIYRKEFEKRKRRNIWENLFRFGVFIAAGFILYWLFKWRWIFVILSFPAAFYYIWRGYLWLRTTFTSDYICDITSYQEKGSKILILQRIEDSLQSLCGATAVNVTFISHSLGTVIASDFVWEKEKPGQLFSQKIFLSNFFTMGSPLPLFSLQFGGPDVFNKPIAIQDPLGRWVNIYDKNDPIAYPLKPLNAAYNRVVLKDQEVHAGMFGIAHLKYWTNQNVHLIIARKLALDWLRFNNALDKARLDELYIEYDRNAGI